MLLFGDSICQECSVPYGERCSTYELVPRNLLRSNNEAEFWLCVPLMRTHHYLHIGVWYNVQWGGIVAPYGPSIHGGSLKVINVGVSLISKTHLTRFNKVSMDSFTFTRISWTVTVWSWLKLHTPCWLLDHCPLYKRTKRPICKYIFSKISNRFHSLLTFPQQRLYSDNNFTIINFFSYISMVYLNGVLSLCIQNSPFRRKKQVKESRWTNSSFVCFKADIISRTF